MSRIDEGIFPLPISPFQNTFISMLLYASAHKHYSITSLSL
jgi:hypothetical protein